MNQGIFNHQISRLKDTYGDRVIADERVKLIWKEIPDQFSDYWFVSTIDAMISCLRQAPMVSDFREAIAKERERLWSLEKREHEANAQEFWHSSYSDEDKQMLFGMIKKRMLGGVPDNEWDQFVKMLNAVADSSAKLI